MNSHADKQRLDDKWHKAIAACEGGDLNSAVFLYRSLVEDGELCALAEIARLYEMGSNDIKQDVEEAASWYRRAVYEVDDPKAHLGLARLQFNKALDHDVPWESFQRHAHAALAKGEPEAALLLGLALDNGRFGSKDAVKAKSYYQVAADAGFLLARKRLAVLKLFSGHVLSGLFDLLRVTREIFAVAVKDPDDRHLVGLERPARRRSGTL